MVTTTRVKFTEQSQCVTAETLVESTDLSDEDVLKKAEDLFNKAHFFAIGKTMSKIKK